MAKLAPTQIEQLQGIGAYLSQVRQQQGLALDVLANQIFIRPALLQALEAGQGAELPEAVFIQGFIRRYAEALGLDGQAIAQEFQVTPETMLPSPELLVKTDTNGAAAPAPAAGTRVIEPTPPAPSVRRSNRHNSPLPLLLSLGALAAILALGAWGLWGRNSGPTTPDPVVEAPPVAPPVDELPEGEAIEPSPAVPLEAPVVVTATLSDRAWLSVEADGENLYEGVAESGFEETWTAEESLVFRTGNAGGVELSVNGDRAVVMGDSGVVRTVTLTPESDVESVEAP